MMRQAKQRIFGGDTHVAEKLVSIFEPTTEIICKGKASKPEVFHTDPLKSPLCIPLGSRSP